MSHSRGDSFLAISKHDEYFLTGGDLYFMIDHVQFRVHRYFFERESPFFRNKMNASASPGVQKIGASESSAIILEDVKPAEFARFLWVFYNPKYSIYNASVGDWSVILRLAHQWTFHEVKDLAVRELEKLDSPDIDRIVLYHECQVDKNLLIPRYAALCAREQPLALEEGERLGMATTLMIARAREYARGTVLPSGARSPVVAPLPHSEIVSLIRELFGIPASAADEVQAPSTITVGAPKATTTKTTTTTTATNGAPGTTSTTTTTTTAAHPVTNGNEGSKHSRKNSNMPVSNRPAPPPPGTAGSIGNSTSSAPDAPPKLPLKVDTNTGNGANGTGTSPSANGKPDLLTGANGSNPNPDAPNYSNGDDAKVKDTSKEGAKEKDNKDKDKSRNSGRAGGANESGASRSSLSLDAPDSAPNVQNPDLVDLMKGEDLSGKQSPTPKSGKGRNSGWLQSVSGNRK